MHIKKCVIIVLDSLGVGAQADAAEFGDAGSNTLGHICQWWEGKLKLPNMEKLGLGNIGNFSGISPTQSPAAFFGKMKERSVGKDTTVGHWEIAGIITEKPFPTYPNGFPVRIIKKFKEINNIQDILGNKTASGTEIIKELGEEHQKTGYPIVYTSADSVFQIAAHEETIPVNSLYEICEKTRKILTAPDNIARVIARPFAGKAGSYKRTERRKDFSLKPPKSMLNQVLKAGFNVISIGKIVDIFSKQGISEAIHTDNNTDGIKKLIPTIKKTKDSLIFANLVDFDMKYGHRNDPEGYGKALMEFDDAVPKIIEAMDEGSLLIITADHGCDPTYKGTDHTREAPLLIAYAKGVIRGKSLGNRESFADIAETVLEYFGAQSMGVGKSFKKEIFG